jgi:predicted nucleic acid-binding protein
VRPEDVPEGPLVVDTDVFSYLLERADRWEEFERLVSDHPRAMAFASFAEALVPIHRKGLGERRSRRIRDALSRYVVLPYNTAVAEEWARLRPKLEGHLRGGGTNDLWIAACALTMPSPLPVVTNNLGEFQSIRAHAHDLVIVHPDE